MIWILLMLFLGVFLSGFFSGSETGFYRASRVRFVMDGIDGDRISKRMLWLFNNPTLFVATTLVGNNVANYLVSFGVVLAARYVFPSDASTAEILAPIALAPALFVYGELLPKNIFFLEPNRMLRRAAPLFLFFTILFVPVAAVLWSLGRFLEKMLGQSPEKVRLHLARRELQDVLQEGQEAGLLHPSQRLLGQNFFLVASKPVGEVCTPLGRAECLPVDSDPEEIKKLARRKTLSEVMLYDRLRSKPLGYVRTLDLWVQDSGSVGQPEPRGLMKIRHSELFGEALLQMQAKREPIALIVSENDQPMGLLSINQLTDPLLKGPLDSLRR